MKKFRKKNDNFATTIINQKNDKLRMNMVVEEINRLSNMKNDIETYYKSNIDKLIHNHKYIRDFYLKNETNLYFLNLTKK